MTSQSRSLVKSLASSSSSSYSPSHSDRALMPPPSSSSSRSRASTALSMTTASSHPPKRIKRPSTVLDEDNYTDALGHIIARDFFPGLLESRAEQTYLDAVESGDLEWIAEAKRHLYETREGIAGGAGVARIKRKEREAWIQRDRQQQYTGERTPVNWRGSTPGSIAGGSDYSTMDSVIGSEDGASEDGRARERRRRAIRTDLSLTAFQAKYTSEDNESFNALLDKQAEKKAAKYSWLTDGNKILSKRQIAYRTRQNRLLEEGNSQSRKLEEETGTHEDGSGNDKSGAMIIHSSSNNKNKDTTVGSYMAGMEDTRPAMPDIRPPPPRNSLMFPPDSVEDTHETVAQAAEAASKAGPKTVVYPNTRMMSATRSSTTTAPRPSSPTPSAIRDAVAGRPRLSASESGSVYGHDNSNNNNNGDNESDAATPRVNGYTFVDEEPEPGEQERLHQRQRRQQLLLQAQQEEQEQQKQKLLHKRQSRNNNNNDPSTTGKYGIDSTTDLLAPLTETRRHHDLHNLANNSSHDKHTNPFPGENEEEDDDDEEGGGGKGRVSKSTTTTTTNPFKIRQSSRREALHHALVARTAAKKRAAAASVYGGYGSSNSPAAAAASAAGGGVARAGRTPTPRFASAPVIGKATAGGGAGNLTPAGQKLLRSIGTPRGGGMV